MWIAAVSPYGESLTSATASSNPRRGRAPRRGRRAPRTRCGASGATPSSTRRRDVPAAVADPRRRRRAPSRRRPRALSTASRIRSMLASLITGPISSSRVARRDETVAERRRRPRRRRRSGSPPRSADRRSRTPRRASTRPRDRGRRRRRRRARSCRRAPAPSSRAAGRRPRRSTRPVAAEPVKLTRSTRGSSTSGAPASGPSPWTTFSTPAGRPASRQSRPNHHARDGRVLGRLQHRARCRRRSTGTPSRRRSAAAC